MDGDDSDETLLAAWRAGDNAAGEAFAQRHFMSVYRFFVTKVAGDADDLTQRTFLDLQRRIGGDGEVQSIRAYLMTIARNHLYMHLRKRVTHAGVFDPAAVSVAELGVAASPSLALARRREQQLLLRALRAVPLDTQVLLELYYWEDLKVRDVATILEVPQGTVMSRLSRARQQLRTAMETLGSAPELVSSTMANLEGWAAGVRAQLTPTDE